MFFHSSLTTLCRTVKCWLVFLHFSYQRFGELFYMKTFDRVAETTTHSICCPWISACWNKSIINGSIVVWRERLWSQYIVEDWTSGPETSHRIQTKPKSYCTKTSWWAQDVRSDILLQPGQSTRYKYRIIKIAFVFPPKQCSDL